MNYSKILKVLFFTFILIISNEVCSQSNSSHIIPGKNTPFPGEQCASHYMDEFLKKNDPSYNSIRNQIEQFTQQYIQIQNSSRSGGASRGVLYTIPIVFHIMHEGEAVGDSTNISDAQVQSCLDALNRDFRRLPYDDSIALKGPLGADTEIEFCLAQKDPNGNYSNGITRHDMSSDQGYLDSGVYHNASIWRSDVSMKALVQWNPSQYLNIWVVNKIKKKTNIYSGGGGGVIGYATFPGGSSSKDGVVIRFSATGNDIKGTKGFNLWSQTNDNRVLTHEFGHYFNLFHTFQGGSCAAESNCNTQGDRCCDTPPTTVGAGNNCASPQCMGNENKENYMQYQNNLCAADFTPNQVSRMRAVLAFGGPRHALTTNSNCQSPYQFNPILANILNPQDTVCETSIRGEIVVCNGGWDTLKSFKVNYKINAGSPYSTFTWNGIIAPSECDTIFLPSIISATGNNYFHVTIDSTQINGSNMDIFTADNTDSLSFFSKNGFGIVIDITTDCNPSEITWVLRDSSGNNVGSGGGYTGYIQQIIETACLDSGCYTFTMYDIFGNGLQKNFSCPSDGTYELRDVTSGKIITKLINPNFGDSIVNSFCLPFFTQLIPGFEGCDSLVYAGFPINFRDTSISTPAIHSWYWDFGDGTTSTLKNPVKTYATSGNYTVKLVVQNAEKKDSISKINCVNISNIPPGYCDTLDNYDLSRDSMIYYKLLGTWGYYPGHNGSGITGYAEPFNLSTPKNSIQRVILPVVKAHSGSINSSIAINVYKDSLGKPDRILSTDTILLSSLTVGVSNEIYLRTPAFVTGNFWVGVEIDYANSDTLVFTTASNRTGFSTSDTNTTFVKAGGVWKSSTSVTAIKTSSGIRVIYTDLPSEGKINVTKSRLCAGQFTDFSATSLANYDSLEWFFPGGTPSYSTNINQRVTYNNVGTYDAILYLEGVCSNDSIVTKIVVDTGMVTANFTESSLSICEQDTVKFNGTVNGTSIINWTFTGGFPSFSNKEDDTIVYNSSGSYSVKMKVENGCDVDSISKVVTVKNFPQAIITPDDTSLCAGSSVLLTNTIGANQLWSTGSTSSSITVSPSIKTTYWSISSNSNCTGDTAFAVVKINPIPTVIANATPDTICLGGAIYFSINGSNATTYEWDFDDGNTSTIPNQNYTYTTTGTFTVKLKGTYGLCDSTASTQVVVYDCTGLGENELNKTIVIYPNPTNNVLNISFTDDKLEEVSLEMINSTGQIVFSKKIENNKELFRIDLKDFSKGIYLLRFNSNNKVITKKVIVMD